MTIDSKTRHSSGELADAVGNAARVTLGSLRRMAVKVTSRALWQVLGHRMLDGSRETRDAEVFYGIGIWARPKSSEKAEALVAFLGGGAGSPVIVATRNEDARRAVAALLSLGEGETVLYASGATPAVVHVKPGTVEIKLAGGIAEAMVKGETYRTAEDTMLTAIKALATALASSAPAVGTAPQVAASTAAATAAAAAITTFQASAAAYLSTVGKVQ